MDIRKLQRAIVDGLEDVKAQDIVVFNTEHLSPLFERVIIASGTSNRQTKALAASVRDAVRRIREPVLSTEGGDNGEWIIVDCGAAVAHIMQPSIRDYYRLEEIWGGKPVKMKLGDVIHGLVKAQGSFDDDDDEEDEGAPALKRAAARSVSAKPKSAPPESARRKAPTAKTLASKSASKKDAIDQLDAKGVAAKKAAIKKAVIKKATARRPAADQAPARVRTIVVPPKKSAAPAKSAPVRRAAAKPGVPARKSASLKAATGAKRPVSRKTGPRG